MRIGKAILWWISSVVVVSSSLWAQGTPPPKKIQDSCRRFVQRFYDWYIPKALKDNVVPASDLALRHKSSAFGPEVLRALKDDSAAQANAAGEIVGLDFDPFLNSQDPRQNYVVKNVTRKGDRCRAEIYGLPSDEKLAQPDVVAELLFKNARWLFVNFHYGESRRSKDENLIAILEHLRRSRQRK